ncbi:hypothetical protein B0H63DRAFT_480356 [Podospora didyma]|uniref:Pentatricopeptide repeat domain-containing protein n=1 Tax=Podospora didyma TaxID=330526 RepID=A0AAE0KKU9_9PEZI|nr:hypothetical protein B0H63DRAFT_480356 [Podospora didyma]
MSLGIHKLWEGLLLAARRPSLIPRGARGVTVLSSAVAISANPHPKSTQTSLPTLTSTSTEIETETNIKIKKIEIKKIEIKKIKNKKIKIETKGCQVYRHLKPDGTLTVPLEPWTDKPATKVFRGAHIAPIPRPPPTFRVLKPDGTIKVPIITRTINKPSTLLSGTTAGLQRPSYRASRPKIPGTLSSTVSPRTTVGREHQDYRVLRPGVSGTLSSLVTRPAYKLFKPKDTYRLLRPQGDKLVCVPNPKPSDVALVDVSRIIKPKQDSFDSSKTKSSLLDRLAKIPVRSHGELESVFVRPATEFTNEKETRRYVDRRRREVMGQLRMAARRVARHEKDADWRQVLTTLTLETPENLPSRIDSVKILFPRDSAKLLLSESGDGVWDIKSRTGVYMHFFPGSKLEDAYILLSGDATAVASAVQDIMKITKNVTVTTILGCTETDVHTASEEQAPDDSGDYSWSLMSVPSHRVPNPHTPFFSATPASEIARPEEWTKTSFESYVAALVLSRLPRGVHLAIYGAHERHQEAVARELLDAFKDPAAQHAVTVSAFKTALAFLVREAETTFKRGVRALMGRISELGLPTDSDVSNILLERAVKHKDLFEFRRGIRLMLRRGHHPTFRTWRLFLRMFEAEDVKRYILHAMQSKNLIDGQAAVIDVAKEMAKHDAYRAVQLDQSLEAFVASQDELYGSGWLNLWSGNFILEVWGCYGKFDHMLGLLETMLAQSITPSTVTLNILITHCKLHDEVDIAIRFLSILESHGVEPDDITYHLFFHIAWKFRKPHMISVLWRLGCLNTSLTYNMRRRIKWILNNTDGSLDKLALQLGINPAEDDVKAANQDFMQTFVENLFLGEYQEATGIKNTDMRKTTTFGDLLGVMRWYKQRHVPTTLLGESLRKALDRDREIQSMSREGKPPPSDAIDVPTRDRLQPGYAVPFADWLSRAMKSEVDEISVVEEGEEGSHELEKPPSV